MEQAAVCLPASGNEYGGATLPISAASDSGVAPSPGTPLQDEADRSLMREMLVVLSEINEGVKQLNEKLNKWLYSLKKKSKKYIDKYILLVESYQFCFWHFIVYAQECIGLRRGCCCISTDTIDKDVKVNIFLNIWYSLIRYYAA